MNHETMIQTGIRCKKILHKSPLNSACFRSRIRLAINKKPKYFSLPDQPLPETSIYAFGLLRNIKKVIKENL